MNISIRIFFLYVFVALSGVTLSTVEPRKKILVCSSKGGGGHISVSNALKTYLGQKYDIEIINIFEILNQFDPVKKLSNGWLDCEDFYNFCLQRRMLSVLNVYSYVGTFGIHMRYNAIKNMLSSYCKSFNPDLIISVTPFINGGLLEVAEEMRIPFVLVTNDLDTTHYAYNIKNPQYPHFYYTLAFNDAKMREKISYAGIPESQMQYIGFPLRPEFFIKKDKVALKKEFNIPLDKPVTMVFTGANGSIASYRYVRILSSMNEPMHIIACAGRNKKLKENLENIVLPPHVSLTVMGYTQRISDLMTMSDWLFTKSGSNSVVEAMTLQVPMIIDHTSGRLWWENMNAEFVRRYGFGGVVSHYKQLKPMVKKIMKPINRKRMIERMGRLKKTNFEQEINQLIDTAFTRLAQERRVSER